MTLRTGQTARYLLAVFVLFGSALAMQSAKRSGSFTILKKPLPIRRPLMDMDRDALAPYKVVRAQRLSSDIVQELGTEEYINWVLKDPEVRRRSAPQTTLSASYYTDVQDQVPHVPEECYFQGAFAQAGDDSLVMRMEELGREIPVRRLVFFPPREFEKKSVVYYTICVNGEFFANRLPVRLRMKDPRDTHLYYSKVEVAFKGVTKRDDESLNRKARAILGKAIGELMRSHWPEPGTERGGSGANSEVSEEEFAAYKDAT